MALPSFFPHLDEVIPHLFTIPAHRAFADALAAGLIAQWGKAEPTGLARGLVLLPNDRAVRALTDAFVRRAGGGLLLPRLVPIGDVELEERVGGALDPIGGGDAIPPAIEPVERQMRLARLVQRHRGVDAAEAVRLASDLGRTLDQLRIEEVEPTRLREIADEVPDLQAHWQASLEVLELILTEWPKELAAAGKIDLADRRNRLLTALERRWRSDPPPHFVCAAGITAGAPAIARLLRRVARLEKGQVVLPALDVLMPPEEWESLADADGSRPKAVIATHPQHHLKLLLDRMGFARGEVLPWRWGGGRDATAARGRAIGNAMAPAEATPKWQTLPPADRRLTGVRALELADPAEEAQAIALALREALEEPGRTAALVTPDRQIARRVVAHLGRWGIAADDSAGRPLSQTPPGTLLLALAEAAVERFAPVPLLTLLTHPLVRQGEGRPAWLEGARLLDLALRGPRPAAGLTGVTAFLDDPDARDRRLRARAVPFWAAAQPLLTPLEAAVGMAETEEDRLWRPDGAAHGLPGLLASLRETAGALAGDAVWSGQAGRQAAELIASLEEAATAGPERMSPRALPALLAAMMDGQAVRPAFGQHPRIFIWGLIEARLQQADLMILGGLNEGTWPTLPAPDPWLAPRIRSELGLPSLEHRIGLAAHDFACALGAPKVLVTRARRAARSPAVASRFWLRIEAMTGGVTRAHLLKGWARGLDAPTGPPKLAERPRPAPDPALRPRKVWVTDVDRLKADPYAFYAKRMLALRALDPLDADPGPAWRGSAVHAVLEAWMNEDGCDPAKLAPRAAALLDDPGIHPMLRALWQPRLMEAVAFIEARMAEDRAAGRLPLKAEAIGEAKVGEITLCGIADRIDRCDGTGLAIVDYKTGKAPSPSATAAGFSLQLGLLGLIAQAGGFEGVAGVPSRFEYWSLAKDKDRFGKVVQADKGSAGPADFVNAAAGHFAEAADKWLTGAEPFTAKLHPAYAPYGDYDQLMRLDEWYGREG